MTTRSLTGSLELSSEAQFDLLPRLHHCLCQWLSCACRLPRVMATYASLPGWGSASCGLWATVVIVLSLIVPEAIVFRAEASERRRFLQDISSSELRGVPGASRGSKTVARASHSVSAADCSVKAHA